MNLSERLLAFESLGNWMINNMQNHEPVFRRAFHLNGWFSEENCRKSFTNIATEFLLKENLQQWVHNYSFEEDKEKTVGIVMAGNLPMVSFHDFLAVLISGCGVKAKLSSKDNALLPYIVKKLVEIEPSFKSKIAFEDQLKDVDAIIATGSNNSSRYFEYYFGKYPNIIRKNRVSVAVLKGNESASELENLGDDIFSYFGLGCRNVSKLFLPGDYDISKFMEGIEIFRPVIHHNKYKNNFDYNLTLLILNKIKFYSNNFVMLTESESLASPIATIFYEYYKDEEDLNELLRNCSNQVQCVVGAHSSFIPFGSAQKPGLDDFADNVNTLDFLETIRN